MLPKWTLLLLAASALAQDFRLTRLAGGLPQITDLQSPRDGTGRMFAVQQNGSIWILRNARIESTPFLDISSRTAPGGERGLLGLAFPPGFAQKRYFYVNYTDLRGDTVIARYRVRESNPDSADPASEQILLRVPQPFSNHNGGQIQFGPDGYLYIGMGDGGSARDPQNHGQRPDSLLGKMLRIDVESGQAPYRVPPDNPFVSRTGFRPEIWALGLRNPWRFAFDRLTGDLYIADVGQNRAEEINFQPATSRGGENYGWVTMEGLQCLNPGCNQSGLTLPIWEYTRELGVSVSGGYVYRGARIPALRGMYLYADFGSGRFWGLRNENGTWVNRLLLESRRPIATFGEEESGELLTADYSSGEIFRIEGNPAPVFTAAGVVNGASFRPGLVAGSIATVFALGVRDAPGAALAQTIPLPEALEGISVTVEGRAAPLYGVAAGGGTEQVNFQVPWEAAGRDRVTVAITRNGVASAPVAVPLAGAQPGVFTRNGADAIVVTIPGNTLVSAAAPAEKGQLVYFYATGLGPVRNAPATGAASPRSPLADTVGAVRATLGGVPCEVLFAGLAPDFVGLYQVNIRIPASAPSGNLELVVSAGGADSPAVRVPVR
jgi:uncharacterized protein (TIGR03437 family)